VVSGLQAGPAVSTRAPSAGVQSPTVSVRRTTLRGVLRPDESQSEDLVGHGETHMSDEPKNPHSVHPIPTDEIDEEWTGGTASPEAAPSTQPVTAKAESSATNAPTQAKKSGPGHEDDLDGDDDEVEANARSKSARPHSGSGSHVIPKWGPWAVLGALMVLGLVGGLGGLNGLVKLQTPLSEGEPATAPNLAVAAAAPGASVRPLASAHEIDPKDRETIEASHILICYQGSRRAQPTVTRTKEEAKKRAEEALAKAEKKSATFEKLVAEYSDEPKAAERGGKLGAFTRRRVAKEFSDAAFALKPGQMSGVVETVFGYHVILRTK
jgi:hypothetical protein